MIHYGKQVGTRIKRSDAMLRLLVIGSNRKKYGPRPGFSRKRLLKYERKRMEKEIREEIREKMRVHRPSIEEVTEKIVRQVAAIGRHRAPQRIADGWVQTGDGQ